MRGGFQYIQYRLATLADGRQCETAKHRDEQHRQHFTLIESADESVRDDVHEKLDHSQLRGGIGVLRQALGAQLGGVNVHAHTGFEQVDRHQANNQTDHGQRQEQQHGLAQQTPEGAFVAHAGNTGDDGAEHHRSDHHLDQLDEGITKRLQGDGLLRPKMSDQHTQQHGEENLEVERFYNFHGITHF
ncbi:hypothetical protein D3C84_444970 [compost metagenome]